MDICEPPPGFRLRTQAMSRDRIPVDIFMQTEKKQKRAVLKISFQTRGRFLGEREVHALNDFVIADGHLSRPVYVGMLAGTTSIGSLVGLIVAQIYDKRDGPRWVLPGTLKGPWSRPHPQRFPFLLLDHFVLDPVLWGGGCIHLNAASGLSAAVDGPVIQYGDGIADELLSTEDRPSRR